MTKHQIVYFRHKENGECTRCGRKLTEDEKSIALICLTCRAKAELKRQDPKQKEKVRIYSYNKYHKNPRYHIDRAAERWKEKRKNKICIDCSEPVWRDKARCKRHMFWKAADSRKRRAVKKASNNANV